MAWDPGGGRRGQGDAWGALRAIGVKGVLVVIAVFALLIVLLLWLVDRRDDASSCGQLEQMIERVSDGEQDALSEQSLANAEAVSIQGMAPEPGMLNVAVRLNAAVNAARNDEDLAPFPVAVAGYASACGIDLPEDSPFAVTPTSG